MLRPATSKGHTRKDLHEVIMSRLVPPPPHTHLEKYAPVRDDIPPKMTVSPAPPCPQGNTRDARHASRHANIRLHRTATKLSIGTRV